MNPRDPQNLRDMLQWSRDLQAKLTATPPTELLWGETREFLALVDGFLAALNQSLENGGSTARPR